MRMQVNHHITTVTSAHGAGLFLAPQTVGESLKGGRLLAAVATRCGLAAAPPHCLDGLPAPPSAITSLRLGSRERMLAFCAAVQRASPVGSYITPTPGVRIWISVGPDSSCCCCLPAASAQGVTVELQQGAHARQQPGLRSTHVVRDDTQKGQTAAAGATPGYGDEVVFADGTFIDGSTAELSADGPLRPPFAVYCQGGTHWTHWALALEAALPALAAAGDE